MLLTAWNRLTTHTVRRKAATIEADREFWLGIEKRWRELADAFQFQQRVDRFIKSNPKRPESRP